MPMSIKYQDRLDILAEVADTQAGFFSALQATQLGVPHTYLGKLANSEHIVREGWGVYRFARWPYSNHSDLWRTLLWTQAKRGPIQVAFSHRTALELHEISDISPNKIELTLPIGTRVRRKLPPAARLHFAPLHDNEIVRIEGLPVTSIYRTLTDLILEGSNRDAVKTAIDNASARRLVTHKIIDKLRTIYALDSTTLDYLISARNSNAQGPRPKK